MKKIGIITGTRAEYGILKEIIDKMNCSNEVELQLIVTGMHLSPEFGLTYQEIEEDGYFITEKIEMLMSSDTTVGIAKSVGVAMMGFADCFERLKPDMVLILGDRYEMLAAATAAMIARIPIAHLYGGDLTEGAMDDAIRHSITKMSTLHFTSTEQYRKRVIQLGEQPEYVYNVGALGVENVKRQVLLKKEELEESIQFLLDKPYAVVTYHPVTLEEKSSEKQFRELLKALDKLDNYKFIFTKANSDTEGRIINQLIDEYVKRNMDKAAAFTSLGMIRYLSALKYCDMVIGNSSSGLIEAPSFKIPTVNIGNRQKGRERSEAVIDCGNNENEIWEAMTRAIQLKKGGRLQNLSNPYEGKDTSLRIYQEILKYLFEDRTAKAFYDIDFDYNDGKRQKS